MNVTSYPAAGSGWASSGNALGNDGVYATSVWSRLFVSGFWEEFGTDVLTVNSFSFAGIGSGDTIRGIVVEVEAKRDANINGHMRIAMYKGATGGSDVAAGLLNITDTVLTLGASTDLWGLSWTQADLANLAVKIYANPTTGSGPGDTVYIDFVRVTVYYDDTTPNAFDFADVTAQPLNTTVEAAAVQILGMGGAAPASVSGVGSSEWRKNSGSWSSTPGTVSNGDYVQVRHNTGGNFATAITTTLSIGGVTGGFTTTTQSNDSTPDAFDFTDVSGVQPSTLNTSDVVVIGGINTAAAVTISGGEYSRNSGAWTAGAGTCNNGDTFQVRGTSSASFSTPVNVVLTVGGVSGTYTITTRVADTTPNPFTFTDASSVAPSSVNTSNTITVGGIEAAASTTFSTSGGSAHQYSKNGGAWTNVAAITLANGDTLAVRLTAPASGTAGITVNIGGVADTYSVTVSTGDTTPDAFLFVDEPNAGINEIVQSNEITIVGIDTSSAVSFSTAGNGSTHQYRKYTGGVWGAWTAVGATSILNGEKLQVRLTAPAVATQTATLTMTVGGVADSFNVTATPLDTIPNQFTFVDASGSDVSMLVVSAPVTITGINTATPLTISGGDGQYRINGGTWTSSAGTVVKNDVIEVRVTSAATLTTTVAAVVTIGTIADTFSVTTRSPDTAKHYVETFRETGFGVDV